MSVIYERVALIGLGLVAGSIPVTLTVGADTITTAIAENVPEERDARIQGIRVDDYIYVDLIRATPIGDLPIEVEQAVAHLHAQLPGAEGVDHDRVR